MRAAHILRKYVPAEWGGTETALQSLSRGLAEHGLESVVFCPATGSPPGDDDPLRAVGCQLRRFRACVPIWGLSAPARRQMLAVGGNLLSFDLPWHLNREPELLAIHTHTLGRLGGIAGTIARRRNLPFVVTIHGGALDLSPRVRAELAAPSSGVEWGRLFGWWWRARHVLAEADAILTCNHREAELLRERHPRQRVIVQPHGVAVARYRLDRRPDARAAFPAIIGREVLLTIARIDPVKNQLWLVQQMPRILAAHADALLVLVGACTNADYGAQLHRGIRDLGLAERVLITGGLPPGDPRLVGLMQEARLAILPSLAETFGLVILEAWAAGLAVLASRTSGAVELVQSGENGCLFAQGSEAEFHAGLDRLLGDSAFRTRQVENARTSVAAHDLTTLAGQVKDLYLEIGREKHALRHSA
ncbi:MAG TPA: glycosyltransferase family 4 protein [Lacunisphaera sp.]|nr:glycosyltransferase family 4 protein [Lacunisphaera sp.]